MLTALDVLGYERPSKLPRPAGPADRPGAARGAEPYLPGARRGHRGQPSAAGVHPRACARTRAACPRPTTWTCSLSSTRRGSCSSAGNFAEAAASHEHYRLLRAPGRPRRADQRAGRQLGFPCVSTDDGSAAVQAFTHQLGHERIAWCALGPEDHAVAAQAGRLHRGRAARADERGPGRARALFSLEGGQAATTRMLRQGVTGVICASDVLALGAIRAVRRAGSDRARRRLRGRLRRLGLAELHRPAAHHVRQPIQSMGGSAVALLVVQMETVIAHPRSLLFEPELVVRGSTGPAPIREACPVRVEGEHAHLDGRTGRRRHGCPSSGCCGNPGCCRRASCSRKAAAIDS